MSTPVSTNPTTRTDAYAALAALLERRPDWKFSRYGVAVIPLHHPAFQLDVVFTPEDDMCEIAWQMILASSDANTAKLYDGLEIAFVTPSDHYTAALRFDGTVRCALLVALFDELPLDQAKAGWFELMPLKD